jgi:lysophospholipase L1-like esterase
VLGGRWYLERASPVIEQEIQTWLSPVLITIWFGANDAALSTGHNSAQHVSVEDYRDNLHEIIRQLRAWAPRAKLLLITPPPVDDDKRRSRSKHGQKLDRANEVTGHYAEACRQVADEAGVEVLDIYAHFNEMTTWRRKGYFVDGLHFNSRGNKEVEKQLREKIEADFSGLVASLERWQLPDWQALID